MIQVCDVCFNRAGRKFQQVPEAATNIAGKVTVEESLAASGRGLQRTVDVCREHLEEIKRLISRSEAQ